jgi:putative radical SAM enzyme (TIGR03279 family)
MPAEVQAIAAGSPARRAGIRVRDRIVAVNGRAPRDYIDYRYLAAEPHVSLLIETDGTRRNITINKLLDEDLGLQFTHDVFDGVITCRNRCPFCFVGQLPKGLRSALYLRDDDYRLSFLHGNFITLTNLTNADRARIVRLHLSPLYVSVHATQPPVRRLLFGRQTADPLAEMRRLGSRGIRFHCQIVVCPGINDGAHLEQTARDLAALHAVVASIGVVPVGLTRHRKRSAGLRPVTKAMARELIGTIRTWQRSFMRQFGTRLVFAADELYLLAGRPLPGRAHYEGFPQIGNGIGCARRFLDGVRRLRSPKVRQPVSVCLVTGEMAAPLVGQLAARLASASVEPGVCVVPNRLFGRSVTTAGLLAGHDVARAIGRGAVSDLVIVPRTAVREGEGFIDGMTPEELSDRLGRPVVAASTPAQVGAALRRFDRWRSAR